jgi:hypothetical protein
LIVDSIINDRISLFLSKEFYIVSRAERSNKKRPDIICRHNGLLIGIKSSYDKRDAEKRLKEQLADSKDNGKREFG